MEVIIPMNIWSTYIVLFFDDKELHHSMAHNLFKEMKTNGYANEAGEIVLDKDFTLEGFWYNFKYYFKKSFLDYIFKKTEELTWQI